MACLCFDCEVRVDAFHPFQDDEKVIQEKRRLQHVLLLITLDCRVVTGELSKLGNQADEKLRRLVLVRRGEGAKLRVEGEHLRGAHGIHGVPEGLPDPLPALPQKVREGAKEPAGLLTCIVVEGDVGVLDDPLAVFLQDAVCKALLLLGVGLDGLLGDALLLPVDELLDGADLRQQERGDIDTGRSARM